MKDNLLLIEQTIKANFSQVGFKYRTQNNAHHLNIDYDKHQFSIQVIPLNCTDERYQVVFATRNHKTFLFFQKEFPLKNNELGVVSQEDIYSFVEQQISEFLSKIDKNYQYAISIIIPVYNRATIIDKCINSINEQTLDRQEFEVIFVDDCSTDNTVERIEELIGQNIHYRILKRPINSGGAGMPRNDGICTAKGRFIFFLDSDDYISCDCLEKMLDLANANNSDIVVVKQEGVNGREVAKRPFSKGTIANANYKDHHLMRTLSPLKLFRTRLIRDNYLSFPTHQKGEDLVFVVGALSYAKKISILADRSYLYIVNHSDDDSAESHLTAITPPLENEISLIGLCFSYIQGKMLRDATGNNGMITGFISVVFDKLREFLKSPYFSLKQKKDFFNEIFELYDSYGFRINKKSTYKEHLDLVEPFLRNEFEVFYKNAIK